jgi:hypothetical protein
VKWTDEALEEIMDAIESGNTTLRKANRFWSIPLNSLFNHLNGKTWTKKVRVKGVLTTKEDVTMVIWILAMQKIGLSIKYNK